MGWWEGVRTFAPRVVYRCRYVGWSTGPPLSIPRKAEIIGLCRGSVPSGERQGCDSCARWWRATAGRWSCTPDPGRTATVPCCRCLQRTYASRGKARATPDPARQHWPRTRRTAPAAPGPCCAPAGSGQSSPNLAKASHTPLLVRRRVRVRGRRVPGRVVGRRRPRAQPARADPARQPAAPRQVRRSGVAARALRHAMRCGEPPHQTWTGYERAAESNASRVRGPSWSSRRMSDVSAMLCRWSR